MNSTFIYLGIFKEGLFKNQWKAKFPVNMKIRIAVEPS
jgi:hypothetical protein